MNGGGSGEGSARRIVVDRGEPIHVAKYPWYRYAMRKLRGVGNIQIDWKLSATELRSGRLLEQVVAWAGFWLLKARRVRESCWGGLCGNPLSRILLMDALGFLSLPPIKLPCALDARFSLSFLAGRVSCWFRWKYTPLHYLFANDTDFVSFFLWRVRWSTESTNKKGVDLFKKHTKNTFFLRSKKKGKNLPRTHTYMLPHVITWARGHP